MVRTGAGREKRQRRTISIRKQALKATVTLELTPMLGPRMDVNVHLTSAYVSSRSVFCICFCLISIRMDFLLLVKENVNTGGHGAAVQPEEDNYRIK